jgi:hypothetical protein
MSLIGLENMSAFILLLGAVMSKDMLLCLFPSCLEMSVQEHFRLSDREVLSMGE